VGDSMCFDKINALPGNATAALQPVLNERR
jgi:hypothetical protein